MRDRREFIESSTRLAYQAPWYFGLRQAVRSTLLSLLGRVLPPATKPSLRCLYAHWVFSDDLENFRRQLKFLTEHGQFISTQECIDILREDRPLDDIYYHLSFDDGSKELVDYAVPVLEEFGIPALFFVPSYYVGADYDRLEVYSRQRLELNGVIETLDWRDCRQLVDAGFEIGAHSHTHARLTEISASPEAIQREVADAKSRIEDNISRECPWYSWPYGSLDAIDDTVLSAIRDAGYRACFGGFRKRINPGQTDLYKIPRHHFEADWPVAHLQTFVSGFIEA